MSYWDKELKNVKLAKKALPLIKGLCLLGIVGLAYCAYKLFFFEYASSDGTPFVYAIYALIISIGFAPLASLGLKLEMELDRKEGEQEDASSK